MSTGYTAPEQHHALYVITPQHPTRCTSTFQPQTNVPHNSFSTHLLFLSPIMPPTHLDKARPRAAAEVPVSRRNLTGACHASKRAAASCMSAVHAHLRQFAPADVGCSRSELVRSARSVRRRGPTAAPLDAHCARDAGVQRVAGFRRRLTQVRAGGGPEAGVWIARESGESRVLRGQCALGERDNQSPGVRLRV